MSATLRVSRPSLISPLSVAGLGAGLLIVLTLTFQNMGQIQRIMAERSPDLISIRYLELMTRLNPEDTAMRVTLARQFLQVGQPDAAAAALKPLLVGHPDDSELIRLEIEIEQSCINALLPEDPRHSERIERLVQRLGAQGSKVKTPRDLAEFARISLALNRPRLAAEFYQRLSLADPTQRLHWLEEAARWFTASGDGLMAGDVLDEALRMSSGDEARHKLAIQALDAYMAGMEFARAIERGSAYREQFPQDGPLLKHLVGIASASDRPDLARDWGRTLVAGLPGDEKALREQIARELAVSDYFGAWSAASQLARLDPACESCQEQAAGLAEQSGQLGEASKFWLAKVRAGDHGKPLNEALRLALAAHNDVLSAELLGYRLQDRSLTREDYFAAELVYKRSRPAGDWVAFLHRAISRNPNDRLLWEGLVFALGRGKDSAPLIAALEAMEARFGRNQESSLRIAQLLVGMGKRELALQKLRELGAGTGSGAKEFWMLYGDLAWQLEASADAAKAYAQLAEAGSREALVFERLVLLARKSGRPDEAIDYAQRGWRLGGDSRLLILAMDTAVQAKRWDRMGALLDAAAASEGSLARNDQYWLLKARFQAQRGHIADATESYEHLLRINPAAHSARAALLWMLIDRREKTRLAEYVDRWHAANAVPDQALSDALGAAYVALGRNREALDYYERSKQSHKNDPLWLLQYAELLQKSGQFDSAVALREFVLRNFRSSLATQARSDKQSAMAYLNLVEQRKGAAERYRAFEALSRDMTKLRDRSSGKL